MFKFGLAAFSCYLILYYPNSLVNPVSPRGTPEWTLKNLNVPQEDGPPIVSSVNFLVWSVKTTEFKYLFLSVQVDLKNDCSRLGQRGLCCVLSCVSLRSMDCSPPGPSVHGILQGRILGCHFLLQGIFLTQGSNPRFLHLPLWQADSLPLAPPGSPEFGLWHPTPVLLPGKSYGRRSLVGCSPWGR